MSLLSLSTTESATPSFFQSCLLYTSYKEINSNFQGNVGMELDIIDGLKLRGVAASTFNLTDNPTHVNTMKMCIRDRYRR